MRGKKRISNWKISHHWHLRILIAVALGVLAAWLFYAAIGWGLLWLMNRRVTTTAAGMQVGFLLCGGMAIIVCRMYKNPLLRRVYRDALSQTCWHFDKPLPLGSCYYTLTDFLIITGMFWLAMYESMPEFSNPSVEFLKQLFGDGYGLSLRTAIILALSMMIMVQVGVVIFFTRWHRVYVPLLLAMLPLVIYPHFNRYIACLVLLMIYGISVHAVNRRLKSMLWESPYYDNDPVQRLRDEALKSQMILGSMRRLAPRMINRTIPLQFKLLLVILFCWWIHAAIGISQFIISPDQADLYFLVFNKRPFASMSSGDLATFAWIQMSFYKTCAVLLLGAIWVGISLLYLVRFITTCPIHVYARPFTGTWWIRKFDLILIPSVLIMGYGVLTTWLFLKYHNHNHITLYLYLYLTSVGIVLIQHYTTPSAESWWFTWNHSKRLGEQPSPKANKIEIQFKIN